jgi:hypothetical protein
MIRGDTLEQALFVRAGALIRSHQIEADTHLGALLDAPPAGTDAAVLTQLRYMYDAGGWVLLESALADLPADQAHAALTAVHGIGPWTADIYLLSCLGHADAWPAGDLALQEAARIAFGLRARPTAKEMTALGEPWRPWRAVAARVLWTYYRSIKGREGAPVAPAKPIKKRGRNGR